MNLISDVKTDINMREVTFTFSAEQLEAACERVYQRQKRDIQIKGFRKGKVPRKMVEKLYGADVFFEDAVNSLLPEELDAIITELGLTVIDRPQVELVSCTKEEGATCKAVLITKPEVTITEYKGVHAPMRVREITDADIDRQLDMERQKQARVVDVEGRPAALKDEVTINFEGFIDDVAFEGGKGESYPLTLGSGQFIPGFEDQIVGHSIGDAFDVNVTFPENYNDERYAGKAATFKVELLGITTQELPALDDDFAKDISEFDTLAELREDIRKKLADNAAQQAQTAFENALFDKIVENTDAVIPQVMYDRRISQKISEFSNQLQTGYGNLTLKEYLEYTGMTMEQLRDEYEPQARKEVTLRLALEKIAELENITVSDEEMNEELEKFAGQLNVPVEVVRTRLPLDEYRLDLVVTKVVELIKNNAVVDNETAEEAAETAAEETAEAAEATEASAES